MNENKSSGSQEKVTFGIDKRENFSDWYNEIIRLAELVDMRYGVKGFIVYREWSTISIKKIFESFEKELEVDGHSPTIFPIVIPEKNFEIEKDHVEGFTPEVLWVTEAGSSGRLEERLAMRPTSETAMYPMYAMWVRSYRDLPMKLYQSGPVWRYETKATRPFVRGREFWWIESHDVFETDEGAKKQVWTDLAISRTVLWDQLGIPILQFQRPQWDKFAGADETFVSDAIMPNGRFLQLPSTHLLGQRFAKAFGIKFLDQSNEEAVAYQTCYGPGITRIYGAMIATHGDNSGLVLPYWTAPVQVVVIPILGKKKAEAVSEKCREITQQLKEGGIRARLDESDARPGDKYYFHEMKGVPFRVEVGARELAKDQVTVFTRDNKERIVVPLAELRQHLEGEAEVMLGRMKAKAWAEVKDLITNVSSLRELASVVEAGKVARIPYCSMDFDGEVCAQVVKAESGGGDVRGRLVYSAPSEVVGGEDGMKKGLFDDDDKPATGTTCLTCDKPATVFVYVGKQY